MEDMKSAAGNLGRCYVVVLNWRGCADTLECLESLFRSDYADFRVVVCDNGSGDGSLERIAAWACGEVVVEPGNEVARRCCSGELGKPLTYFTYTRSEAECGGQPATDPILVLIDNGANLGFAAGNNVGLRYIAARGDAAFVWLLNNDTVVEHDSLRRLVERACRNPGIGMWGSMLLYYHNPTKVQAWGGARYDPVRGVSSHLGVMHDADLAPDVGTVEREMAYVVGASLLVTRQFLDEVGLMTEDYFLYFEEHDWARRAHGRFGLGFAPDSVVFHKEGGSAGSSHTQLPSSLSLSFLYGNRLKFTRRYYPQFLLTSWLRMAFEMIVFLKRGQLEAAGIVMRAILGLPQRRFRRSNR